MAVPTALCLPGWLSPGVFFILTTERVTASGVSCRLEEITGFFARNNEEYLALIFEKEGSYLGREVSCLQGSCISWIDIVGERAQ